MTKWFESIIVSLDQYEDTIYKQIKRECKEKRPAEIALLVERLEEISEVRDKVREWQ